MTSGGGGFERREWDPMWLAKALEDPKRPTFLMGCTPPREGTTPQEARDILQKFVDRSRANATDGFIVYDIQDESSRNAQARPFPFRRTMDPAEFASYMPGESGKSSVLYKVPTETNEADFDSWLANDAILRGHRTINLVGPAAAADGSTRISLAQAAARLNATGGLAFGCVTIAERHLKKGTEHLNILRKTALGARWFISQAVYDAEATVKLLKDYAAECRARGESPRKILLTFAPASRPKTLEFCNWLGIHVPEPVRARILAKAEISKQDAANEAVAVCVEILKEILEKVSGCGVPLGISVESVSGFKEEIEAAFELFRRLQKVLLDSHGHPWGVRWYRVPISSLMRSNSEDALASMEAKETARLEAAAKQGQGAAVAATTTSLLSSGPLSHSAGLVERIALICIGAAVGVLSTRLIFRRA